MSCFDDKAHDLQVTVGWFKKQGRVTYPHPIFAVRELLHNSSTVEGLRNANDIWIDLNSTVRRKILLQAYSTCPRQLLASSEQHMQASTASLLIKPS